MLDKKKTAPVFYWKNVCTFDSLFKLCAKAEGSDCFDGAYGVFVVLAQLPSQFPFRSFTPAHYSL